MATLVEYGADLLAKDNNGRNVLFYIFSPYNHNRINILNILLNESDYIINDPNDQENTILLEAINRNETGSLNQK